MQGRLIPNPNHSLQHFPSIRWKEEFSCANSLGFDYVELLYDKDENIHNPLFNNSLIPILKEEMDKSNVEIYSLCADYFTDNNILSQDNYNTITNLTKIIELSNELNISVIVLPLFGKSQCSNKKELVSLLNNIKSISENVMQNDITLCLETSLNAQILCEVLANNMYDIGICVDLGNVTSFGYDLFNEIVILGNYIKHVHIKDRLINDGPNVLIGSGDVDFNSAFDALNEIHYSGNYTLETSIGDRPIYNAKKHISFTKSMISNSI